MPINDAHCHFFSPRFFSALAHQRDLPRAGLVVERYFVALVSSSSMIA
jgi:hypothetical protein